MRIAGVWRTTLWVVILLGLTALIILASGGSLVSLGTYPVYNGSNYTYRFNPASVAGATWYTGYEELDNNISRVLVSTWNGSAWGSPVMLNPPNGVSAKRLNLAWDSVMQRPLYAYDTGSVYFGYYDAGSSSWVLGNGGAPVFPVSLGAWSYPSVDVDASGRIVVGACFGTHSGYWTVVSLDHGQTFSSVNIGTGFGRVGTAQGYLSRLVATNNKFETFVPVLNDFPVPTGIQRYESTDGTNWTLTQPSPLVSFAAPLDQSPGNYTNPGNPSHNGPIWYAPFIDAHGYTDGNWSVVAEANISFGGSPYNNVIMCTSMWGACYLVNSTTDDEFLASTSMSGDGGVWVSYAAYSTLQTRQLPLITQSIYFPASGAAVGGTTYSGIDPTYWKLDSGLCLGQCFNGGVFWKMSSNPYMGASAPFIVQDTAPLNAVWQAFIQDPPGPMQPGNFKPNVITVPFGADISRLGVATLPAQAAGSARGFSGPTTLPALPPPQVAPARPPAPPASVGPPPRAR